MADGSIRTPGTGENVATFDVGTYQGVTNAKVQVLHGAYVTGSPGSHTLHEIHGAATPATTDYGLNAREVPQVVTTYHLVTLGTTNAANISAVACRVLDVHIYCATAAAGEVFVKLHNTAGTPTAGTGVVYTVGCQIGTANHQSLPKGGRAFATGLGISVVSGIADASAAAVGASDAVIEVVYVVGA